MTVDQIIDGVFEREKGFVNDGADSGGPTCWGITQAKLSGVRGRPVSEADVRALTQAEARDIYRRDFAAMGLDAAPEAAREVFFDIITNHGPGNAVRMLQRALGIPVDGVFGKGTRAALAAADGRQLFLNLVAERMEFTGRAISKNLKDDDHDGIPDNTEFAAGWLSRQAGFVRRAP